MNIRRSVYFTLEQLAALELLGGGNFEYGMESLLNCLTTPEIQQAFKLMVRTAMADDIERQIKETKNKTGAAQYHASIRAMALTMRFGDYVKSVHKPGEPSELTFDREAFINNRGN